MKKKKSKKRKSTGTWFDACPDDPGLLASDKRRCAEQLRLTREYLRNAQPFPAFVSVPKGVVWDPSESSLKNMASKLLAPESFSKADKRFMPLSGFTHLLLTRYDFYIRKSIALGHQKLAVTFAIEYGRVLAEVSLTEPLRRSVTASAGAARGRKTYLAMREKLLPHRDRLIREAFLQKQEKDPNITVAEFWLHPEEFYKDLRGNKETCEVARTLKTKHGRRFIGIETVRLVVKPRKTSQRKILRNVHRNPSLS